jgi:sulfite exporter TauE/SafE
LLAYNAGRVLSYVVAGLVLGAFGVALMNALTPWFGQEWPRMLAGVVMLLIGLNIAGWLPQLALLEHVGQPLWRWLQPLHHRLTPVSSLQRALLYGLVWGWLPCGVVYAMLITAMAQDSALIGGWLMLAFGIGTLPSVIATGLLAGRIQGMVRNPFFRRFAGLTVILFGLMALVSSWTPAPGASLLSR